MAPSVRRRAAFFSSLRSGCRTGTPCTQREPARVAKAWRLVDQPGRDQPVGDQLAQIFRARACMRAGISRRTIRAGGRHDGGR